MLKYYCKLTVNWLVEWLYNYQSRGVFPVNPKRDSTLYRTMLYVYLYIYVYMNATDYGVYGWINPLLKHSTWKFCFWIIQFRDPILNRLSTKISSRLQWIATGYPQNCGPDANQLHFRGAKSYLPRRLGLDLVQTRWDSKFQLRLISQLVNNHHISVVTKTHKT